MAELSPPDVWVANGNRINRWQPVVDAIEVHPLPDGKMIVVRLDGVEREIRLDVSTARHLAGLLTSEKGASHDQAA